MTSARLSQFRSIMAMALVGSAGLPLVRVDEPGPLDDPKDWQRQRERAANERRWAEMTQADIDRLTAAHEKRERRKAARQGS